MHSFGQEIFNDKFKNQSFENVSEYYSAKYPSGYPVLVYLKSRISGGRISIKSTSSVSLIWKVDNKRVLYICLITSTFLAIISMNIEHI